MPPEACDVPVIASDIGGMAERIIDISVLTLEVEGKYYVVTVDMNSETVKSVEEQNLAGYTITTGPDGETTWSEGVPEEVQQHMQGEEEQGRAQ